MARVKSSSSGRFTRHFDVYPRRRVTHPSRQPVTNGQTIDEGPETHTLHHSTDMDTAGSSDIFGHVILWRSVP